jgi:hypothetical protein
MSSQQSFLQNLLNQTSIVKLMEYASDPNIEEDIYGLLMLAMVYRLENFNEMIPNDSVYESFSNACTLRTTNTDEYRNCNSENYASNSQSPTPHTSRDFNYEVSKYNNILIYYILIK